jgi:hypothetical protein
LLRDLLKTSDPQTNAVAAVINHLDPDVLLLTDFDYDLDGIALAEFSRQLQHPYPVHFALQPNTGLMTGFDIDKNGRTGDARDAQSYGLFAGDGGMAILSRLAIDRSAVIDLSAFLWRHLPGAVLPTLNGSPYFAEEALAELRLSTAGHWVVPVMPPDDAPFALMAFAAGPPVFDGPEDRNGLRNRDELRLWNHVLGGGTGIAPESFVVLGNANLDPSAGDGYSEAMSLFLADPRLQDPLPGRATADWRNNGPGLLRVSYVLPSADWTVVDAGVFWPAPDSDFLGADGLAAGPHRLVWVDIAR